jgi:hypothetical protein
MKKTIFILFIPLVLLFSGCAMNMQTAGTTKFEKYHPVKKIALLPAAHEKKFIADRMDKINYQAMEPTLQDGYVVVGVDKIKKYLGGGYEAFAKNPTNKKVIRKIAKKFGVEAVVSCEVTEWRQDAPVQDSGGKVLNKVSLTYTSLDAKTLKPLAKNSGSNENTAVLSEESVITTVAKELAAKLIKSVL